MWPLFSVCVFGLLGFISGQDHAAHWRGNDRSGRCQYTFTVPSPSEASCPPAVTGGPEMEGLKARLSLLEVLVTRLTGEGKGGPGSGSRSLKDLQTALTQTMGERSQLLAEKERLQRDVEELQKRMEDMRRETERLRSRPCHPQTPPVQPNAPLQDRGVRTAGDPAWQYGGSLAFQEMKADVTEVPAPSPVGSEDRTDCGELLSISEPVSHRMADSIAGKYGVWMQDPEAVSPYGGNMVWRIDTVGTEVRQLFGYEDMDQLSKGFPTKVLLLPESVESTGATMYRGSLYYQRRRSRTLLRFDLATESIAARRDLPHAGFHGQFPYSWGGYTDIDLEVDEQGLWVVYSTSKARGAIVISKLDPNSLEVNRSWETSIRKNSVANAFVICGRLYTLASYTAPNTTVNFMFDTATGQGNPMSLPFRNKYRYNSMVGYNPAQRKLYAWDNFHMVSYDVTLGRQ
uniref:Myocilin n=1 Tax=Esox lucius TaxID=8010 RepID=A0AAY5KJ70_ESOLU